MALSRLDIAADRVFDSERATRIARSEFERSCEQFDRPMPEEARRLAESDREWA